jgi:signal transduction histidine kinase
VADNGIGIDKDLKEHVFEDFFTSKGGKGTGLGLMVTQKILREHGGNITFRSRPGEGTTFVATFPRQNTPHDA